MRDDDDLTALFGVLQKFDEYFVNAFVVQVIFRLIDHERDVSAVKHQVENQKEPSPFEADLFIRELAARGDSVLWMPGYDTAAHLLRTSEIDLLITDESLSAHGGKEGLRLAEIARDLNEIRAGNRLIHAIILSPTFDDWERIQRARTTGAHVIAKKSAIEPIIGYIRALVKELSSDLALGPILFGFHAFHGHPPVPDCSTCAWRGGRIAYGINLWDFTLERVDTCILNALLRHRRGLSTDEIAHSAETEVFLKGLLGSHHLAESAIKMRISRIRNLLTAGLAKVGAPYTGRLFLPHVIHGHNRYRLAGNWQLIHVYSQNDAA